MIRSFAQLDRILRGEATRLSELRSGNLAISARQLSVVLVLLGMLYGICMGLYSLLQPEHPGKQMLASMVKVPMLFFLTLLVTFPSLYVFNALVGSRLSIVAVMRLLVAAMGVMLAVLASFGTIVAFFSASTSSYPFMVLLNVVVFAVSGILGLTFLLQTLHRLSVAQGQDEIAPPSPLPPVNTALPPHDEERPANTWPPGAAMTPTFEAAPLEPLEGQTMGKHVRTIFRIWVIVFGLVGAQMGWVLRPFIGRPDLPFTFFRTRESNFFQAVALALKNLLGI